MLETLRGEIDSTRFKASPAGMADILINDQKVNRQGLDGIPRAWVDLCEITPSSTRQNNPYHSTVRAICDWLRPNEKEMSKSAVYFSFIGGVHQEYSRLLQVKDHRALLILSYWYGMLVSSDFWWCHTRAYVECQAICKFLERHANQRIRAMLDFPAKSCGYALPHVSLDEWPLAMAVPDNCSVM